MVSIELDTDQLEAAGIAYIKQCYETKRELLDGCELTDEDANEFKILEGMLAYVLTIDEMDKYLSYCEGVWPKSIKQTNLSL